MKRLKQFSTEILLGITIVGFIAIVLLDVSVESQSVYGRIVENFIVGYLGFLTGAVEKD